MDSRPGDETLLLGVAERNLGAFRTHDAASGTSVLDAHRALDVITRPGVLPDGMSRRWGA